MDVEFILQTLILACSNDH